MDEHSGKIPNNNNDIKSKKDEKDANNNNDKKEETEEAEGNLNVRKKLKSFNFYRQKHSTSKKKRACWPIRFCGSSELPVENTPEVPPLCLESPSTSYQPPYKSFGIPIKDIEDKASTVGLPSASDQLKEDDKKKEEDAAAKQAVYLNNPKLIEFKANLRNQIANNLGSYPYLRKWRNKQQQKEVDYIFDYDGRSQRCPKGTPNLPEKTCQEPPYKNYLIPDLDVIFSCSFYWGKMDRFEADRLLDQMPDGTFLLRDSAQDEYLFSVSFRRYERTLHARVEQLDHSFSFDPFNPNVFSARSVNHLIDHYKNPTMCMFFEPLLLKPFKRRSPLSLLNLSRQAIWSTITYDQVAELEIPHILKCFLKEYSYKVREPKEPPLK